VHGASRSADQCFPELCACARAALFTARIGALAWQFAFDLLSVLELLMQAVHRGVEELKLARVQEDRRRLQKNIPLAPYSLLERRLEKNSLSVNTPPHALAVLKKLNSSIRFFSWRKTRTRAITRSWFAYREVWAHDQRSTPVVLGQVAQITGARAENEQTELRRHFDLP